MSVTLTTARQSGAVAIVQLHGPGSRDLLTRLTGIDTFHPGRYRLANFADIDEGLAVCLRDDWAQLMPHGGPRVVQKLIDRLIELGSTYDANPDPRVTYPEADSAIEADVLATIARAASPAAIDLLLAQPERWRRYLAAPAAKRPTPAALLDHARKLDRLIDPPTVVVVGPPNVGKSTLTNRMLGRSVSIVADLPGTTRDWVAGLAEINLPPAPGSTAVAPHAMGLALRWLDTPGLRRSDDPIEQEAIELAQQVLATADVLIAMRDPATDWPDLAALPQTPAIYLMNKVDDAPVADLSERGRAAAAPLPISAAHDLNVDALQTLVLQTLQLTDLDPALPWAFSATLKEYVAADQRIGVDLAPYVKG